jgi:hypothetical protein
MPLSQQLQRHRQKVVAQELKNSAAQSILRVAMVPATAMRKLPCHFEKIITLG